MNLPRNNKKRLGPGVLATVAACILIAITVISCIVLRLNYRKDFVPGEHYEESLSNKYGARRELLAEWGVDLTVPGSGGKTLTVTVPKDMNLYQSAAIHKSSLEMVLPKGAVVECDFITWTSEKTRGFTGRSITLTYNGKTYDGGMKDKDVFRLYRAALDQNGLEAQFQADTGEKLTSRTAKRGIQTINKQIYDLGIYTPYGYPYNFDNVIAIALAVCLFSLPVALSLAVLYIYFRMAQENRAFLEKYNAEHIAHWDEIEGELPQFTSYANSGIRGPGERASPALKEIIQSMFKVQK